jgi:hypothetical protein
MSTRKTRSLSVIFFDTENDARRRRFLFNENKSVANMTKNG